MRKLRLALMMAGAWCLVLFAGLAFGQGSLTPPGAPAPTMKTLGEVEPRRPIMNLPYMISAPGSFYLTTNLTSMASGIVVRASSVTVDMMGFSISGDRGSSDFGIWIYGATNAILEDVIVRNGIITRFGDGIRVEYARSSRLENLHVSSNLVRGIYFRGAYTGNVCNRNWITDCAIHDNGSHGIYLDGYSGGQCNGNMITDCAVHDNADNGIYLDGDTSGQCNGNVIARCAVHENGGSGIYLYGISGGQCAGNAVVDCMVRQNTPYGIFLYYADGNRVEGNHVSGVANYGIRTISTAQNLILHNTCVGQTNNYSLSANDTYGPIVTNIGALPSSGDAAHPWANFSR